jgi:hypothetical protein
MKTRCYNFNTNAYKYYGGRAITVCDEWKNDFMNFYIWAINNGYRDALTLDRINNDGNYSPDNCRWVTIREQSLNRRDSHLVTVNDITKPLNEWCRIYNINSKTVRDRIKRGWSYEKALTSPIQAQFRQRVV